MSDTTEKTKTVSLGIIALAALSILIIIGAREMLDIRHNSNRVPLIEQQVTILDLQVTTLLRDYADTNKAVAKEMSGVQSQLARLAALIEKQNNN